MKLGLRLDAVPAQRVLKNARAQEKDLSMASSLGRAAARKRAGAEAGAVRAAAGGEGGGGHGGGQGGSEGGARSRAPHTSRRRALAVLRRGVWCCYVVSCFAVVFALLVNFMRELTRTHYAPTDISPPPRTSAPHRGPMR